MNEHDEPDRSVPLLAGCILVLALSACLLSLGAAWLFLGEPPVAGEPQLVPMGAPQGAPPAIGAPPGTPIAPGVPPPGTPLPPTPPGTQLPPPPTQTRVRILATVTTVSGSAPVAMGATCDFSVEEVGEPSGCRAQATCNGVLLYGGPSAGFFPCQISQGSVSGRDTQTTAADSDASFFIDTNARTLRISDDARGAHGIYSLSARIEQAR